MLTLLKNVDDGVLAAVLDPAGLFGEGGPRQRLEELIPEDDELREKLDNLLAQRLDGAGQVARHHPPSPFSPSLISPRYLANHNLGDEVATAVVRLISYELHYDNTGEALPGLLGSLPPVERNRALWWLTEEVRVPAVQRGSARRRDEERPSEPGQGGDLAPDRGRPEHSRR